MAQGITSLSQLESQLQSYIPEALIILGEDTKSTLIERIKSLWYGNSQSDYYERSMSVLNSITLSPVKKEGSQWEISVYCDPDKIPPIPVNSSLLFPSHMNITDSSSCFNGQNYGMFLPLWLEEGESSSIHSREAEPAFGETIDWLVNGNNYLNEFASIIEERTGFKTVVV